MSKLALILLAALPLAGCVTTTEPGSQERAYCERMEREMGTDHRHDHAEAKGMGMNPMNVTHARCRQMLGIS
ncbi:hypothetical protein GRI40_13115 [Altererythrobacter aerius]|jgi:hypothetical protein|uniref:Lipoprotein n=1 Tax=Tsuneonella aeria TaxID=1837929 RepID=A0A6I4TG66_9SPHN|nr:hypothetical protein [Tsuneonella aeria]MXO76153.1 hypothetical protein [Tsuneonella aeria]